MQQLDNYETGWKTSVATVTSTIEVAALALAMAKAKQEWSSLT